MKAIQSTPFVEHAIRNDAVIALGVSGGKDSQAAALATFDHLDALGHRGTRILVHSDLGTVEWHDSLTTCEKLAEHLGVELVVVRRKAGGLMERWRGRWNSSVERYETLSTVTLVPCWSTPKMRFCTSELKTHVIDAYLKRRFGKQAVINVTGIRRDESSRRAKATVADQDVTGGRINWRPIVDWSVDDVFAAIDASGLDPHPGYRVFGLSRVSCRFCIMSNINDLAAAAGQDESHVLYREMVDLECDSTFAFQGARWLGDVAPHLLTDEQRARLSAAKSMASSRMQVESRITKPMLYVKGWPTRMLTDGEADLLAGVRQEISTMFGFSAACLDRESVHRRYDDLLKARADRAALEIA